MASEIVFAAHLRIRGICGQPYGLECLQHSFNTYFLQVKAAQADMQHMQKEKLAQLAGAVTAKIAGYRDMLGMFKVDVRTQLQHVHEDQSNTIKRSLYRIQTVRSNCSSRHDIQCRPILVSHAQT